MNVPSLKLCQLVQKLACAIAPASRASRGSPSMANPFGGNRSDSRSTWATPPNPCFWTF